MPQILPGKTTPDPQLNDSAITGKKQYVPPSPAPAPNYSPPPPAAPVPQGPQVQIGTGVNTTGATPPAAGNAQQQGSDTTRAMLDAALRAIEAEYGMTADQLLTEESDIGRQYRLLLAESQRQSMQAQQQVQAGALDRGIVQSGIYADDTARMQAQFAEQQAAYEAQRQNQLAMLATQQANLPAQEAAARAAAAQQAAQAGLDLDVIKAAGGI